MQRAVDDGSGGRYCSMDWSAGNDRRRPGGQGGRRERDVSAESRLAMMRAEEIVSVKGRLAKM